MDDQIRIGDIICGRDATGFFIYKIIGINSESYEGHIIYDPWNTSDGPCEIPFQYQGMHFLRKLNDVELALVEILAK